MKPEVEDLAPLPEGNPAPPSAAGEGEAALQPIVTSLYGLLKDQPVDEDDYKQYLERKYREIGRSGP